MTTLLNRRPEVGERVTVSFTGRVVDCDPVWPSCVTVESDKSDLWHQVCFYDPRDIEVGRDPKGRPEHWPPTLGDIWQADDRYWLVYSVVGDPDRDDASLLIGELSRVYRGDEFLRRYPDAQLVLSGDLVS